MADGIFFEGGAVEDVIRLTEFEVGRMMRQLCRVRDISPAGTMVHVTAARRSAALEELKVSWHLEPADEAYRVE